MGASLRRARAGLDVPLRKRPPKVLDDSIRVQRRRRRPYDRRLAKGTRDVVVEQQRAASERDDDDVGGQRQTEPTVKTKRSTTHGVLRARSHHRRRSQRTAAAAALGTGERLTMCYRSSSPRVSTSDVTGKTGARPARFRHCDEDSALRMTTRPRSGKVKQPGSRHLSARRPTQARCLSFCGEQKTCPWRETFLTSSACA
jgi:hypothetical protein